MTPERLAEIRSYTDSGAPIIVTIGEARDLLVEIDALMQEKDALRTSWADALRIATEHKEQRERLAAQVATLRGALGEVLVIFGGVLVSRTAERAERWHRLLAETAP